MVADLVQSYKAMGCNMSFLGAFLRLSLRLLRKSRGSEQKTWIAISAGHFQRGRAVPRQVEFQCAG